MPLWVIIPVKPLRRGKSRLAGILSEEKRTELNRSLLIHTLETVKEIREVARMLVVSRDTQALALARHYGAMTVLEYGSPDLNTALTRATQVARQHVSRSILILPADLPLLTVDDVHKLIEYNRNPPVIVIAPDRHHQGTNALLVNPPGLIEYDFGPGSFQRHCERASQTERAFRSG